MHTLSVVWCPQELRSFVVGSASSVLTGLWMDGDDGGRGCRDMGNLVDEYTVSSVAGSLPALLA